MKLDSKFQRPQGQPMWVILWLLSVFLLASCHPRGTVVELDAPDTGVELRCHYLLDQKYAADQNPSEMEAWKTQVRADATTDAPKHYDLFTHRGGGPGGAEWNSDGALYIVAKLPFPPANIADLELTLNGNKCKSGIAIEALGAETWVTATVTGTEWSALLKPILRDDYQLLYTQEDIQAMGDQKNGPLGVGKILRIWLRYNALGRTKSELRAFAVAYGE